MMAEKKIIVIIDKKIGLIYENMGDLNELNLDQIKKLRILLEDLWEEITGDDFPCEDK